MSRFFLRVAGALAPVLAFASPAHAMQQDSTDARTIIVVDSLDRASFANVAELLQARVPGLHVARTGDGGMRWFMRGPSSFSESTPMVLIDDVRLNTAGSAMSDIGTRPPLLDEINIEDVERIEVWSGPATAVQHGTGAGNGVIRIVTFAPRAQPTSFRVATWAGTLAENVSYPANANRAGLDTAGRLVRCVLQREATNLCTPTELPAFMNVLESDSPFESAIATRVAAAILSGSERLAWRAGATFDRQGSTAGTLANQRLYVRGAATLRAAQDADLTIRGSWMRGEANLPSLSEQTLLSQGLLARADTAWPGFVEPHVSPYSSIQYTVSANGRWRPVEWLDLRLTSGGARLTDENDLEYTIPGGVSFPPRDVDMRGERRRRDLTLRLDAEARYRTGAIRQATAVTIEHVVSKQEEEFSALLTINGGLIAGRGFWINRRTAIAGAGLLQRVHLGQDLELTGGLRLDQVRVDEVRWDVPVSPRVSVSWNARPVVPHGAGSLRLRAALGDVANVPQTTFLAFPGYFGEPERPKAEITRERELGFDATVFQDRVGASLTWYNKRTNNVGTLLHGGPFGPRFERFEVLNRGVEASLHARILQTSRLTWEGRAWYAYNHNEATRGMGGAAYFDEPVFGNPQVFFSPQWITPGQPVGAHLSQPIISVRDLDADGLIDNACYEDAAPCEVIVRREFELRPAYPPTSASLETSIQFGLLTLSVLLDHRSGHVMNNATMRARCVRECSALYDPATLLPEQAEALLASWGLPTMVHDASYTKLREISLRIETPASWARTFGGSRISISIAGRNVATWTDYSGLDPETTSAPWIPLVNIDDAAVPLPRRFLVRIDVQ